MKRKDLQPGDVFVYLSPARPIDDGMAPTAQFYPVNGEVLYVDGAPPWVPSAQPSPRPGYALGEEHLDREVLVLWTYASEGHQ